MLISQSFHILPPEIQELPYYFKAKGKYQIRMLLSTIIRDASMTPKHFDQRFACLVGIR